jgi:hypothetical protein
MVPAFGNSFAQTAVHVYVQDNYRITSYGGKDYTKRLADDQKYVIIPNMRDDVADFVMPIYVFEGKLPAGFQVTGDMIKMDEKLYVIANATNVDGFYEDSYKTSFVVMLNDYYKNVNFEGDDYYIYGATSYTVEAFDLLLGKNVDVNGYNLGALKAKTIYATIDGSIINSKNDNAKTDSWSMFWEAAKAVYSALKDETHDEAPDYYFFKDVELEKTDVDTKEHFSKEVLSSLLGYKGAYEDLVDSYTVKYVTLENDKIKSIVDYKEADVFTAGVSDVEAYVIVDAKNNDNDVVVYVVAGTADSTGTAESKTATTDNAFKFIENVPAYVIGNVAYDVVESVNDGVKSYKTTLKGLGLEYVGAATADTHKAIYDQKLYFAVKGACDINNWKTTLNGKAVYGSIIEGTYTNHKANDAYNAAYVCDLVNKIGLDNLDQELVAGWNDFKFYFEGARHENETYTMQVTISIHVAANGAIDDIMFATSGTEYNLVNNADINGSLVAYPEA